MFKLSKSFLYNLFSVLALTLFAGNAFADLERHDVQWGSDGILNRFFDADGREIYAVYTRYSLNTEGQLVGPIIEQAFYENTKLSLQIWDSNRDGYVDSFAIHPNPRYPDRQTGSYGAANPYASYDRAVQTNYYLTANAQISNAAVGSNEREALKFRAYLEKAFISLCR